MQNLRAMNGTCAGLNEVFRLRRPNQGSCLTRRHRYTAGRPAGRDGADAGSRGGFSLLEVAFVVVLLALAVIPMITAFGPILASADAEERTTVFSNRARGTMNRLTTLDFILLEAVTNSGSTPVDLVTLFGSTQEVAAETFEFRGSNYTPRVYVTDASGGAGGLLQLKVVVENVRLSTLKGQ